MGNWCDVASSGRWSRRLAHHGRTGCATLRSFKLLRPVFGGRTRRALGIAVTLARPARVTVTVRRGRRVVKRFPPAQRSGTYRLTLRPRGLRRGDYRVTVEVRRGSERIVQTLTSRRL